MCGIAGIWMRDGRPADRAELRAMADRLLHRGPDARAELLDGPRALCCTRLAILDLSSRAALPFGGRAAGAALAYNGCVYNFEELRRELRQAGVEPVSSGDAEVLFHALRLWGPERAVPRFDGMFALAWFDFEGGALWLARDRLGQKPLHVAWREGAVYFASEVKALLALPRIGIAPDAAAVAGWIARGGIPGGAPLFRGTEEVEPGALWKVEAERVARSRWFDPAAAIDGERLQAAADSDPALWADALHRRMEESVRVHLRSDAPVATTLSGGVDSGLIAALARRERPGIPALVADVGSGGEATRALRAAEALGLPLRRIAHGREEHLRGWPETIWWNEEPSFVGSLGPLLALARACRESGIKVLLSGEGADELFGGYPWYRDTYRRWRLALRRALFRQGGRAAALARLERAGFGALGALGDSPARRRVVRALDAAGEARRAAILRRLAAVRPPEDRAFLAHTVEDLVCRLLPILRRNDRMGMAAAVEIRAPFLAHGVIDLALEMPRRAKLLSGEAKWAVREAARRHLPRDLVAMPKSGFPLPYSFHAGAASILEEGALSDLLGWARPTAAAIVDALEHDPREVLERQLLVSTELWLRIFGRGEDPARLGERLLRAPRP